MHVLKLVEKENIRGGEEHHQMLFNENARFRTLCWPLIGLRGVRKEKEVSRKFETFAGGSMLRVL